MMRIGELVTHAQVDVHPHHSCGLILDVDVKKRNVITVFTVLWNNGEVLEELRSNLKVIK